jgi:hypothetical protein
MIDSIELTDTNGIALTKIAGFDRADQQVYAPEFREAE